MHLSPSHVYAWSGNTLGKEADRKKFWSYVKSKRQDNMNSSPLRDHNNIPQYDPQVKAGILNDQFASVFSSGTDKEVPLIGERTPVMNPIVVTEPGVRTLMENLHPNKASGPDGIPARLLKELAKELSPVFTTLFQASLDQSKIPEDWKSAYITPLFKKGDPLKASNYRPVSLTSIPCKLLEHIVHSNVINHLLSHKVLTDSQHGFRKKRSCESQLILTTDDLARGIEDKEQVDVIFLDFSKAFDKVHHHSLLKKLHHYGINDSLVSWTKDFLFGRTQKVVVEGKFSDSAAVTSGVPQGTVLGPLLFLIYINDLPNYISAGSNVRLFADDSAVYRRITSEEDAQQLQTDLDNLQKWESHWSMEFHPQKCQILRVTNKQDPIKFKYSIHDQELEETTNAKYLGVTINNKMSWNTHINTICTKVNNTLSFPISGISADATPRPRSSSTKHMPDRYWSTAAQCGTLIPKKILTTLKPSKNVLPVSVQVPTAERKE